jgi:hypothetical protein
MEFVSRISTNAQQKQKFILTSYATIIYNQGIKISTFTLSLDLAIVKTMAFSTSTAKWLVGVSFATMVLVIIMALISDHPHLPAVQQCNEESAQCIDACFSVNVSSVINNGTGENPMTDSDMMESEDENNSLPIMYGKMPGFR